MPDTEIPEIPEAPPDCDACGATEGPDVPLVEAEFGSRYDLLCDRCAHECQTCASPWWYRELDEFHNCPRCEVVCSNCAERFQCSDSLDDGLCDGCGGSHCEACGERDDDLDEEGFCSCCRAPEESRNIHDYSYRPRAEFVAKRGEKTTADTMYLGVEVEMEGNGRDIDLDVGDILTAPEWYAKSDASLACGVEIVSHPATYAWWSSEEATMGWMARFRSKGYRSYQTTTCGMHVHVSRAALSRGALFRLLKFVAQNRAEILKLSRRTEENMNHWSAVDSNDTAGLVRKARGEEDQNRYSAVNTVPYKTVEFRFFRGTLDLVGFQRNLDLVWAMCSFVKRASNRGLEFGEFVKWLRGKSSRPFLTQKNAERLVTWFVALNLTTRKDVSQCV